MSPHNPLEAKLDVDGCVNCFMVTMPSVGMAQVLAASGVDALILDMEQGPIDLATLHAMIAATKAPRPCRCCACRGASPGSPSRCWMPVPTASTSPWSRPRPLATT